jgi:hypothetical protein
VWVNSFMAATDATGQITSVSIQVDMWQSGTSPHQIGDRTGYINLTTLSGVLNDMSCLTVAADVCITSTLAGALSTGASQAYGAIGTWTVGTQEQPPATPAPTTSLLMLTGMMAIGFMAWRKQRKAYSGMRG